jgi:NADPH:quinone reductase-like Zn-dependent oxidoreductase
MMNAIEITQTGGPEVMQMRDLAIPEPQHGEVLIQVAASGINFVDIFVREGRFGNQTPFTPGQEAAGTVAVVGPGVSDLKQGDRVAWCSVLGTYAEYALAPAERVVPIPDDVTFELAAAAALLQSMTAHYRSRSAYMIQPGDEVLIHAGAGGTGLLLTQMAQSCGARVITGGILGVKPVSNLLTLSVGKAGLRCAAEALFPDFAAQGVHVAVLTIGAGIAPGSKSAEAVGHAFWSLHAQPRD